MHSIARIDTRIAEKHLLTHPFYEAWTAGTLPARPSSTTWASTTRSNRTLPRFLTALHSRCEDAAVRASLLSNAWDEEHGANNHPELWLRFGEALGLERSQITGAKLNDATRALVDTYRQAAEKAPALAGIAAIYAYESQLPAVAAAKIEGLKKHFGVDSRDGLAFFEIHRTLDVHHAAEERRILEAAAAGPSGEAAVACADAALTAWWNFLSAVTPSPCAQPAAGSANEMSRIASLN